MNRYASTDWKHATTAMSAALLKTRHCLSSLVVGAISFGFTASANATLIDFGSGIYSGSNNGVYTEKGFKFAASPGDHTDCGGPTPVGLGAIYPALCWHNFSVSNPIATNIVTFDSAGAFFDLTSIEWLSAPAIFPGQPDPKSLVFSALGHTLTATSAGTILFGWNHINSVTIEIQDFVSTTAGAGLAIIDNVCVNSSCAVPEPDTLALVCLGVVGIAGLGISRRQKLN